MPARRFLLLPFVRGKRREEEERNGTGRSGTGEGGWWFLPPLNWMENKTVEKKSSRGRVFSFPFSPFYYPRPTPIITTYDIHGGPVCPPCAARRWLSK